MSTTDKTENPKNKACCIQQNCTSVFFFEELISLSTTLLLCHPLSLSLSLSLVVTENKEGVLGQAISEPQSSTSKTLYI